MDTLFRAFAITCNDYLARIPYIRKQLRPRLETPLWDLAGGLISMQPKLSSGQGPQVKEPPGIPISPQPRGRRARKAGD